MGKEEFKNPHPELPVREPILKQQDDNRQSAN